VAFVLIVDANQGHATRASDVLIAAGHACGWVTSAEQAITLLRWRVPDLILLDQAIPGADGGNLPQRLRRTAGANGLPIILLTTGAAAACVGGGDNAVLDDIRKPFDPGFLAWRVDLALETPNPAEKTEPLVVAGPLAAKVRSLA
jgi:DNA-binding response OmpR family regulator